MGMQCHFSIGDLPETAELKYIWHKSSDTWELEIDFQTSQPKMIVCVSNKDDVSAWFDVGGLGKIVETYLIMLIYHRVCFTCS